MTLSFCSITQTGLLVDNWLCGLWIIVSYLFDPTVPYDAVEAVNFGVLMAVGAHLKPLVLLVLLCVIPFMVVLILAFIGILSTL